MKIGSKVKEIGFRNGGRFGAIKNLGLSLKLPGFHENAAQGIPRASLGASEDYCNHVLEMEYQKARARAEAQRVQFNR